MCGRKIKDIMCCKYINTTEELYPLQKWYNQLIDKRVSETNVADVIRMIQQKEFMEIAIARAIFFLKTNPFAGDKYEGELLEKVYQLDGVKMDLYVVDISEILFAAARQNETYEWLTEEERKDFDDLIKAFFTKLDDLVNAD